MKNYQIDYFSKYIEENSRKKDNADFFLRPFYVVIQIFRVFFMNNRLLFYKYLIYFCFVVDEEDLGTAGDQPDSNIPPRIYSNSS